jgi:hypothetical protein
MIGIMGLASAWGGMGSHGAGMGRMGPHGDKPTGPQVAGRLTYAEPARQLAAGSWHMHSHGDPGIACGLGPSTTNPANRSPQAGSQATRG